MSSLNLLAAVHLFVVLNTSLSISVGWNRHQWFKKLQQDIFDSWGKQNVMCYNKQRIRIVLHLIKQFPVSKLTDYDTIVHNILGQPPKAYLRQNKLEHARKEIITQKLLPRFDQGLGKGSHLVVCALLANGVNGHPNSGGLWRDTVSVCFGAWVMPVSEWVSGRNEQKVPVAAQESWGCCAAPSTGPKPQPAMVKGRDGWVLDGF